MTVQVSLSSGWHLELRSVENADLNLSCYPELDPRLPCSSCCFNPLAAVSNVLLGPKRQREWQVTTSVTSRSCFNHVIVYKENEH